MKRILAALLAAISLLASCNGTPEYRDVYPSIFPDYIGVTIPAEIAPLNFNLEGKWDRVYVVVSDEDGRNIKSSGSYAHFNIRKWHKLTAQNCGKKLAVTVAAKKDGKWTQFKDFFINVSSYPLTDYGVTYRKFAPGYETYADIGIYQRNIHNFREDPIIEGTLVPGQCVGCHTANATNPDQFLFHVRGKHGATVMQLKGKRKWLATKTDKTISNAVYSYWHPSGDFVAHSNNFIHQMFWVGDNRRLIEVYDDASDVIVHNVRTDEYLLCPLLMTDWFETYPAFSRDGKTLYFCSAPKLNMPAQVEDAHYNLCSIAFDAETQSFGDKVDTLVNAVAAKKSVTFPRPSYDGKWLLYSYSDFGNFPINHNEADLWLMDLQTGKTKPLYGANSDYDESFHNWSSDSHWILVASRRNDSVYTNIYFCQIDGNGNASKPFLMPQKNPYKFYHSTLFTYNVPDFTCKKVKFNALRAHEESFSDVRTATKVKE